MGYRSDVHIRLRIEEKDLPAFLALVVFHGHKETVAKEFTFFKNGCFVDLVYDENSVKWYQEIHDVAAIQNLFQWANDLHDDDKFLIAGVTLRIGEDLNDNEYYDFGPFDFYQDLCISRIIEVSASDETILPNPFKESV
jgi:hypothetical protein